MHPNFLRYASPNEQRTISREDLGFYHAVIVGAIYEVPSRGDADLFTSVLPGLRGCIKEHAFLSVVVEDRHTDKAYYRQALSLEIHHHVEILPELAGNGDQWQAINKVVGDNLDRPFNHQNPPWRAVVLPVKPHRFFMAFVFSHMLGDGPSGISFHQTFLEVTRADSSSSATGSVVNIPLRSLPIPFDTPERLPISWSMLLGPLLAIFTPAVIAKRMGWKAQASSLDKDTWTATPVPKETSSSHSISQTWVFPSEIIDNALAVSRKRGVKLTGLFHVLIARALSKHLTDSRAGNYVAQTAINMRRVVGVAEHQMGEYVSGCYTRFDKWPVTAPGEVTKEQWEAAAAATKQFAQSANSLEDQPIGLLRYLPSMRKWTMSKLGQQRDCSYEMSNLGASVFESDAESGTSQDEARITHTVFAQPGHILSAPICFNISGVKGGDSVWTATWPNGALGLTGQEESAFVEHLHHSIEADLSRLA